MLHNIRPQWLSNIKHSNLLVRFVSYEENEELWIPAQILSLSFQIQPLLAPGACTIRLTLYLTQQCDQKS